MSDDPSKCTYDGPSAELASIGVRAAHVAAHATGRRR